MSDAFGLDFTTGITASVACIGNVGPGFEHSVPLVYGLTRLNTMGVRFWCASCWVQPSSSRLF